jgi:hypothetical protein
MTEHASPALPARRRHAWRNLMVAAINAGLDQHVFELDGTSPDGRWRDPDLAVYEFSFCGLPALGCASDVGFDELIIQAALLPTRQRRDWVRFDDAGFRAGATFAVGWLERREGKWLQTSSGRIFCCRVRLLDLLTNAVIEPAGYRDDGKFFN